MRKAIVARMVVSFSKWLLDCWLTDGQVFEMRSLNGKSLGVACKSDTYCPASSYSTNHLFVIVYIVSADAFARIIQRSTIRENDRLIVRPLMIWLVIPISCDCRQIFILFPYSFFVFFPVKWCTNIYTFFLFDWIWLVLYSVPFGKKCNFVVLVNFVIRKLFLLILFSLNVYKIFKKFVLKGNPCKYHLILPNL